MELNLERSSAKYQIKKYNPSCITVNDQDFTRSLLIMPEYLSEWSVSDINLLEQQDLLQLLELKPEIIILGTGKRLMFPDVSVTQVVGSNKVGFEVMDTAAACRTYTVLMAEGRNVLAALIVD